MRKKAWVLVVSCALTLPTQTMAGKTASKTHAANHDARWLPTPMDVPRPGLIILRQDLFDRNNPNNLRSDWPGPPAQPGQF